MSLLAIAVVVAGANGCGWMAQGQNVEGVRMYQQGAYPAAAQSFQQAIQTDPRNPDGYYNLAATFHQTGKLQRRPGDLQQAESYYHQCLDHDPNHGDCYRGLAVLLTEQGRSAEAFRLLQNWSMRAPNLPDPKIELARLFEENSDRDSATSALLEALAVAPDNPRALAALGKLREEAGDAGQALANYQRSLAQNRFQPQVAARAASLQGAAAGSFNTAPTGTRMVSQPPYSATIIR